MPVLIKVSVSRKMTQDFNSSGWMLDITSELPIGSAQDPNVMAEATDELFRLAEDLIDHQIKKSGSRPAYAQSAPRLANGQAANGNGKSQAPATGFRRTTARTYPGNSSNGNGHGNGSARPGVPGITDAQARAIEAIAKRMTNEHPDRLAQDEFGMNVQDLSVRQASELIDTLKKQLEASETPGGRR
jgi:hypothetical protein